MRSLELLEGTLAQRLAPRRGELLAKHTTLRVGGPAALYVAVRSPEELAFAVRAARDAQAPHLILGGGSNMLVQDGGIDGLCIENRSRSRAGLPSSGEEVRVTAASGEPLASLARRLLAAGLAGLEWAVDVPGSVGGAVVNNAGANGGAIADSLEHATLLGAEGSEVQVSAADLDFGYRRSALKYEPLMGPRRVVLQATFLLRRTDPLPLAAAAQQYSQYRRATQPIGSSAGSMFKNSPTRAAGWLVEHAGLKGERIGGAEISMLHGNFFLNTAHASSADVLALASLAQQRVLAAFGIELELEIQVAGRPAEDS